MKSLAGFFGMLTLLVLSSSAPLTAEEPTAEAPLPASIEKTDFAFGRALEISGGQIKIRELSEETGQITDLIFNINEKTRLENVSSIEEIKPGDLVEIDYLDENGAKIAVYITRGDSAQKLKTIEDEEAAFGQTSPT